MSIDGNYSNIGKDMVQALQRVNQDHKIEGSELNQLREAAQADNTITEGEAQLLQQLEQATQDGQSVSNFQLAEFSPSTLQFENLNLKIQNNQGVVYPDAETLSQRGAERMRRSTNIMDLSQSIESARAREQTPEDYFKTLADRNSNHAISLEVLAGWADNLEPADEATAQHLRQMGELSEHMESLQRRWSGSNDADGAEADVAASLRDIDAAQTLLNQIDPERMGRDTHTRVGEILAEYQDLMNRYASEHEDNTLEFFWPDESLGQFVMRQAGQTERAAVAAPEAPQSAVTEADRLENFREINALPTRLDGLQTASQERLKSLFSPYQGEVSANLQTYLQDPSRVAVDDRADVREEFSELFQAHPALAERVSQELASLQDEFPALRADLNTQLERARSHGQTELVTELEGQLRALADAESQVVRNWQSEQQLILEGLTVASDESTDVARVTGEARQWIDDAQNRYARTMLEDPNNRSALAQGFEDSLQSEAGAEIQEKIRRTTARYGEPVQTVPMVMVSDGTGATMNFNAYVYRDGDEYFALNPMDQKFYSGATPEAALAQLGRDSRMIQGQLHFHDGQEMQQFELQAPEDSSSWDLVMAGVGLVGAGVMICIPEPGSTAAGLAVGAAILGVGASSTYFVAKGADQMHDLIQNDNFGNNRRTWMAAVDIASGLLGVAGAAGSGARLVGGAARAGTVNGVRQALTQSLQRLGTSRGLAAAELIDGGVGLGLAAEQIYQIANDPNLSDRQKQLAVTQIVMFTATPFVMSGVIARNRAHDLPQQEMQRTHLEYMENLRSLDETLEGADLPGVSQVAKENVEPMLLEMESYYSSEALENNPGMRQEGLERIEALRTRLNEVPSARPFQVNEALAGDLRTSTERRAQDIIAEVEQRPNLTPKQRARELNRRAAVAEAGAEVNGQRVNSGQFENISDISFARNADPIPGTTRTTTPTEGYHRIDDVDAYIDFVERKYAETGNELHPQIEQQIRNHIAETQANHDGRFNFFDGLPGLHAEVQAANDLLNKLEAQGVDVSTMDLREVHISTYKLGNSNQTDVQGGPFHACSNCTGILAPEMTVVTGVSPRSDGSSP